MKQKYIIYFSILLIILLVLSVYICKQAHYFDTYKNGKLSEGRCIYKNINIPWCKPIIFTCQGMNCFFIKCRFLGVF